MSPNRVTRSKAKAKSSAEQKRRAANGRREKSGWRECEEDKVKAQRQEAEVA